VNTSRSQRVVVFDLCWVALGVALFIEARAAGTEQVGAGVGKRRPLPPRAYSYLFS